MYSLNDYNVSGTFLDNEATSEKKNKNSALQSLHSRGVDINSKMIR